MFANLGDGTYFHSGLLAIRAALAANVNITYKILYNDAVAMTGGQPIDGTISVPMIAQQMAAEGVSRIALVSEDLSRYEDRAAACRRWLPCTTARTWRRCSESCARARGVSVLIYDQTCAAEKRRRRKKGEYPHATARLFINEAVCEGCGDCGVQSNCTSLMPLETEFGRKRAIDQSSCNQDYSCVEGFCPSFVTVEGGKPRKSQLARNAKDGRVRRRCPSRWAPALRSRPYNILDHRHRRHRRDHDGRAARHGGAPGRQGHLRARHDRHVAEERRGHLARAHREQARISIRAQRIATGEADLILGCDMLTAGAQDAISKTRPGRTVAVINAHRAAAGAVRAESRLAVSGRADPRADRRIGGGSRALHRRHAHRHRPDGRLHRDQPVHARLRLPEGLGAAD